MPNSGLPDYEYAWRCPSCSNDLHPNAEGFGCKGCGQQYPTVQGVALLVRGPIEYLRAELTSLDRARRTAAQRLRSIEKEGPKAGLTETSLNRHRDVLNTDIARGNAFITILEPARAALASFPAEQEKAAAKRSGWGFDSLFPYLLRDWTGTEELRNASATIGDAIARAFPDPSQKAIAFAGCGAAGMLSEIPLGFERIIGFDLTFPVLAAARGLLDGKTLQVPMPRAVNDTGSLVLRGRQAGTHARHIRLAAMDALETAFANDSIDCVVTSFFLDLLPEPAKLASEIHRVLAPGGIWINYGPSGPLQALWRFDESEGSAFFDAAGFSVLETKAVRGTYLDLSRDCPSWSFQNHVCYLSVASKRSGAFALAASPTLAQSELLDAIPEHHSGAAFILQQSLNGERSSRLLFRYERLPGRPETFDVAADAAHILELVDGHRSIREIARLATEADPPQSEDDALRALKRYVEQNVVRLRQP